MQIPKPKSILFAYIGVIILLAILPINNVNSTVNHTYVVVVRLDYLFHALMFVPFGFIAFCLRKKTTFKFNDIMVNWILPGLLFAAFSEGIQYLTPWRTFNINDLLANVLGLIFGLVAFFFLSKRRFALPGH